MEVVENLYHELSVEADGHGVAFVAAVDAFFGRCAVVKILSMENNLVGLNVENNKI